MKKGETYIEIIVAMIILTIGVIPILNIEMKLVRELGNQRFQRESIKSYKMIRSYLLNERGNFFLSEKIKINGYKNKIGKGYTLLKDGVEKPKLEKNLEYIYGDENINIEVLVEKKESNLINFKFIGSKKGARYIKEERIELY